MTVPQPDHRAPDPRIYRDDLVGLVEQLQPASLLAVTPDADVLFGTYRQQHPDLHLTPLAGTDPVGQLGAGGRYRLAIVANTIERMDRYQAGILISKLRDLHSNILYILVPIGADWPGHVSHWEPSEMRAFALRLVKEYTVQGRPLHLYHYDIYNYKHTPDWLNSQYWANPERWDKARW